MNHKRSHLPTATELVEAVADYLEKELLPALEGSRKFNTRVSINALRIVQRELGQPQLDDASLLELADQVHRGQLDETDPELLARLRQHVLARLAIDNPKYSSYLAARERGE